MAGTLDWRTLDEAHRGGSDILIVGLSAAKNKLFTGNPAATATWIAFSYLQETGGTVGRERDTDRLYTEGGESEDTTNRDEFVVAGNVLQTSKRVMDLLDFLEDHECVAKRALPMKKKGPNDETHQLWASKRAKVDKENWSLSTARTDQRTRSFKLRYIKDDPSDATVKPYVMEEVEYADQASWPASLAFAKDTALV